MVTLPLPLLFFHLDSIPFSISISFLCILILFLAPFPLSNSLHSPFYPFFFTSLIYIYLNPSPLLACITILTIIV